MIDHVSLGVRDLARATDFYARVLGTIGWRLHAAKDTEVAFGPPDDWCFFLYPAAADDAIVGARMHLAFRARDRGAVRAFHAAVLAEGGSRVPDRDPDARPQFGDDYYGAVMRDPDGHAIEVLTRNGEAAP
ncbi:MAG TPA: VOC family protein [Xanthomonadales bacterium]|nr:VOC family protein [Xanthomonadales bacterium]